MNRELPEPYWSITGAFTRDQVLAIQKQAYEDGLRDANLIDDGLDKEHFLASFKEELQHLPAMLTASQKRDE